MVLLNCMFWDCQVCKNFTGLLLQMFLSWLSRIFFLMFLLNFVIIETLFHCPSLKEWDLTLLQRYRQTYGAIKTGQQRIKNSDTPENICEKRARRAKKIKWSARYRVSKTPRQISHVEESCRKNTHIKESGGSTIPDNYVDVLLMFPERSKNWSFKDFDRFKHGKKRKGDSNYILRKI